MRNPHLGIGVHGMGRGRLIPAGLPARSGQKRGRDAPAPINPALLLPLRSRFAYFPAVHIVQYAVVIFLAYLLGSIPTGYLAGRLKGVDIRQMGSGNIGATNVFRSLGKVAGIVVLAIDALKGFGACRGLPLLFPAGPTENLRLAAGFAAILGHNYTCWLKFKGGKGIATSAGVMLGWLPWALAIVLGLWLLVFAATRYVSLASVTAALALPFAAWYTDGSPRMVVIAALVGGLAIYKHRSNLRRLLDGTEHRFGTPKPHPTSHPSP